MKNVLLLLSTVLIFIGCSTNNNGTVTVVPIAPTNLTGSVISTSQVNLSWVDNATNEDGYKIERKSGSGSYAVVGSMGVNLTTFGDLGLSPNTTYTYRVYAYNSAGNSLQYSNEVTVTTQDNIPSWLTNGLVAFYPFSGNAGDSSGNGNHGTINGGVTLTTDRFGVQNKAYFFDGTSGYINVPSLNNLSYTPITYSAWVIVNSFFPSSFGHKFRTIIGRNTEFVLENGAIGFYADNNANNGSYDNTFLMWRGGGVTGDVPYSVTQPTLNNWCNVVYSQEANGDWKWYINGQQTSAGNFTNPQTDYNFFRIGGCNNSSGYLWNDKLDDIRVYNRALSQSEVTYLATH